MVCGYIDSNWITKVTYSHPAFLQPDDSSATLWRDIDAVKFEWLITNKRHFFANATVFDDLLEGTTPEGVLEWWETAAANAGNDQQRNIFEHNFRFITHMASISPQHYYLN